MGQPPSLPAPGDVLEAKIEIVRLLGAGGMGAVFEAKNRRTGRHVAVKMLRAQLAASDGYDVAGLVPIVGGYRWR